MSSKTSYVLLTNCSEIDDRIPTYLNIITKVNRMLHTKSPTIHLKLISASFFFTAKEDKDTNNISGFKTAAQAAKY